MKPLVDYIDLTLGRERGRKVNLHKCPKCGQLVRRTELFSRWDGAGQLRIMWEYECDAVFDRDGKYRGYRTLHAYEEVLSHKEGLRYKGMAVR